MTELHSVKRTMPSRAHSGILAEVGQEFWNVPEQQGATVIEKTATMCGAIDRTNPRGVSFCCSGLSPIEPMPIVDETGG